jgi:hypothetical protein
MTFVYFSSSWYMGLDALKDNGITKKLLYLIRDKRLTTEDEPLRRVRKSRILMFTAIELVGFGVTFAVTQTIGSSFSGHKILNDLAELF